MHNIIFLDIDGVMNCSLFFQKVHSARFYTWEFYVDYILNSIIRKYERWFKREYPTFIVRGKYLNSERMKSYEYRLTRAKEGMCPERLKWLDKLCKETSAKVVISSTWRSMFTLEEWNTLFKDLGTSIEVIGKTSHLGNIRGDEIKDWLLRYREKFSILDTEIIYAIIDDDSDMLDEQFGNLFLTDYYSGLTPNTCYRVKRFFESKDINKQKLHIRNVNKSTTNQTLQS